MFFQAEGAGHRLEGHTTAAEGGEAWAIRYAVAVDERWVTRSARVQSWTASGEHERTLASDGSGHWRVDGERVPRLDGCLDVDLECSACTNTLPIHRLALAVGEEAEAPAAYVRVHDLASDRLEQHYARIADTATSAGYDYRAPAFDFECRLAVDRAGLVLAYPGIATRVL